MSGTLSAWNPLMSGAGVNTSIPLAAGQIMANQPNPLSSIGTFADTLGKINATKLQQQALTSGAATVAQHLQQIGSNAMAPFLAIDNPTMKDLTDNAAFAEQVAGGTTQHIMQLAGNNPLPPNTPQWGTWMKRSIAALAQTDPATAVAQAAGTPIDISNGGTLFSGVRAPVTAGGGINVAGGSATRLGLTPGEQNEIVTITDPTGAQHSVLKGGAATTLGGNQPGTVPGPVVPNRGAALPGAGPLGGSNGRYANTPTQPGNPALRNQPAANGPPANTPVPGARVMTDPAGKTWMVPPDKIAAATAAGYR